ncbi:MAG: hypothetical protein HQL97_01920 [Magnetococcales bacterium]|nr:hypothetical protein [Magnetococcales bacterium]
MILRSSIQASSGPSRKAVAVDQKPLLGLLPGNDQHRNQLTGIGHGLHEPIQAGGMPDAQPRERGKQLTRFQGEQVGVHG